MSILLRATLLALAMPLLISLSAVASTRLPASELADPSLLSGPGFSVRPEAEISGLQARFVIDTRWGELSVDSVELLAIRVEEMAAVSTLYGERISQTLKRAGLDQASAPWNSAVALTSAPVERSRRLPAGVLAMFSTKLNNWGRRFRRWGDRAERAVFQSGDVRQGFELVERKIQPASPWWDAPVDEFGRLLRSESGHGPARRSVAQALDIASDTSNPLLRKRLDALAWAIAGQKLAINTLADLLAPGVRPLLGQLERADKLTSAVDEQSLRSRNEERLQQLSADPDLTYWLAWRGGYSAELMAQLLDTLDGLVAVEGKANALEVAAIASNELEARFVLNSLRMLSSPQLATQRTGRLRAVGNLLVFVDPQGELHLCLPVDYLQWNSSVAGWFRHPQIAEAPRRTVLVAGRISPRAEREISGRGWSLLAGLRYPGSPAYPRSLLEKSPVDSSRPAG